MKEDCRLHALSARRALVLAGFDGQILEDSELCIEFSVDKNWIFRFECEKYGAVTLSEEDVELLWKDAQ